MNKLSIWGMAGVVGLLAETALAAPTAQQSCDNARITAWKVYTSCIETIAAKDAKGISFDINVGFAKCRHSYFKKWVGFQAKPSLSGSTCVGSRYTDNGDQTITDNLTGLTWEQKDNASGLNDVDNGYSWSSASYMGPPPYYREHGTVFTSFLATMNAGGGFAGSNGWRLPTIAELQTIVLDFACVGGEFETPTCTCPSSTCIDPIFGPPFFGIYWSSTPYVPDESVAWVVDFGTSGWVRTDYSKLGTKPARAVRGGM